MALRWTLKRNRLLTEATRPALPGQCRILHIVEALWMRYTPRCTGFATQRLTPKAHPPRRERGKGDKVSLHLWGDICLGASNCKFFQS
jgi:hypothetical protein